MALNYFYIPLEKDVKTVTFQYMRRVFGVVKIAEKMMDTA
jgi:hypothetical protein